AYGGVATAMASCVSLSVMVRSTLRVLGGWRGAAVQKAEDVVGDRLGLFEVQEVPRAEDSPTFVMYRSSPAMKLAVARSRGSDRALPAWKASQRRAARTVVY
ncbi:hypothetical protein AB0H94_43185, partial [Streptomyces purpurascens]|uniref:hypothetical protein n=1 Tax=Streptomyces purpurascens TaxID=1924 RepID=UPI0034004AA8